MNKRSAKIFGSLIAAAIIFLVFLFVTSGLFQQGLWMRQVGYLNIFWELLSVKWSLWALSFLVVFLYSWINFRFAAARPQLRLAEPPVEMPL